MNEDSRMYFGIIGLVIAIGLVVLAIIYAIRGYDETYLDKGMIWVPQTPGHWEMAKAPEKP